MLIGRCQVFLLFFVYLTAIVADFASNFRGGAFPSIVVYDKVT
jgi:hypothetical protein